MLNKKSKDAYNAQFRKWDLCLKAAKVTKVEELYKKVFAEIRKKPERNAMVVKEQKKVKRDSKNVSIITNGKHTYRGDVRLNNQQRKDRVAEKIRKFIEERKKAMSKKK